MQPNRLATSNAAALTLSIAITELGSVVKYCLNWVQQSLIIGSARFWRQNWCSMELSPDPPPWSVRMWFCQTNDRGHGAVEARSLYCFEYYVAFTIQSEYICCHACIVCVVFTTLCVHCHVYCFECCVTFTIQSVFVWCTLLLSVVQCSLFRVCQFALMYTALSITLCQCVRCHVCCFELLLFRVSVFTVVHTAEIYSAFAFAVCVPF